MFKNYLTNSEIDEIFSDDGGPMSATSIMICGGPGVGKSTLLFWLAARVREFYPDAKIAVVSSEMEEEDLIYEARKKQWMNSLEFVLTSEYGSRLSTAMTKIYTTGYDIIILDSFADVCDKLKDFNGMTGSGAETFLLELMKNAKGGKNKTGAFTLNLVIQQVTKGGNFAGSNKLKHNTTGMLELRRESSGDRYMVFTKNRRCGQYVGKKLYYFLGANNQISFDSERWEREKAGDETEDTTQSQSNESKNNRMLTEFGEISAESANRLRLLMLQDGITPELIQSLKNNQQTLTLEDIVLPEGVLVDNIYEDATLHFHVLEMPDGETPIFGTTKEEVIQKLIDKYKPIAAAQEEEQQDEYDTAD